MRCPNDDLDRLADPRGGPSWEEHLRRLGFGVGPGLEDRTRALEIRDVLAGAMCHTRAGVAVGVRPVAGGVEIVFLRRSGRAWAAAAVRAVVEPAGLMAAILWASERYYQAVARRSGGGDERAEAA